MPRAMRVCPRPGCPELTTDGPCSAHQREREQRRGTRQQRGYTAQHDRLRERWRPKVELGEVDCHAITCLLPERRIHLGMAWDLGHTEDRTAWTGPEHERCNRSAGGRAAHA
jgi:hypothetical protein